MQINTSRFGQVEIDDLRVITFSKGILGFPSFKRYALLETGEGSTFWWLQSLEAPELAFVVTDPSLFIPTYRVPIKPEEIGELGLSTLERAQVFVIVNKRDRLLTGNLQGPLVINCENRQGVQLVLSDRRFTTRVPLLEISAPVQAMSA
ncbi:MAG: flagellar assembly protein FliW [Phycisphaeraceae bacterium]|nr:flagellar assembly protein FliW [Phycisphaeraceae bacterium]